jgi:hypothetical protein
LWLFICNYLKIQEWVLNPNPKVWPELYPC